MLRTLRFLWLLCSISTFFATAASAQTPTASGPAARPLKVSEATTSSFVRDKAPVKYPEAARAAGIQGTVVLDVVVTQTGDVKEVSVVSGNPDLASAATDAVKQWKYKPYTVDGAPVDIETRVTITFNLRPSQLPEPSLGTFRDGIYRNDSFDLEYPLPRDWVLETELLRKRYAAGGASPGAYVLLAAAHIPQRYTLQEANASFVLFAVSSNGRTCEQYFHGLADELHSEKQGQQKGVVTHLTIAARDFYRTDFEFQVKPHHRAFLCTQSDRYLLQWNIAGLNSAAVGSTIGTVNAVQRATPTAPPASSSGNAATDSPRQAAEKQPKITRVRVAPGVTQGLKIKDVAPIYPLDAKFAHIEGTVVMRTTINKNGDVADLEVLDGPTELVVSAVNAVRLWKYRPYILNGGPVDVDTTITVHYQLSAF